MWSFIFFSLLIGVGANLDWSTIKSAFPLENGQTDTRTIECPDGQTACSDDHTCCQLSSGSYSCCPLASAVCCSDHIHCCPHGYKCDVQHSKCSKGLHHNRQKNPVWSRFVEK